MTDPDKKFSLSTFLETSKARLNPLRRYSVVIFLLVVACLYGFLMFRVNTLSGAEPTEDAVDSQVQAAHVPHIDPKIVKQLQSLQDHSVNVKALFDEARSNPFQ
jgi:lipopolysaccharide export system protein LptC